MSVQDRVPRTRSVSPAETTLTASPSGTQERRAASVRVSVLAVLRILMGLTFLWAFFDKTFGLSYATPSAQAWVNSGSPTSGFLGHVQVGPMQSVLRDWAGSGFVDWLFMIALLGVGLALLLGIGMRVAGIAAVVLLAFMWIAEWPPAQLDSAGAATSSTNPIIDSHLVYIVVVIALVLYAAGDTWGLGRWWARLGIVDRNRWLR